MIPQPNDFLMQAWKQQADGCLRAIQALVDGTTRVREMQLEAAADAHADLEATRKAIAATTDPGRILELQAQWARASAEKCAAYWRRFYELGMQTQASLAQCMVPAPAARAPALDDPKQAAVAFMDQAYKQWLDSAQQLYTLAPIPGRSARDARAAP